MQDRLLLANSRMLSHNSDSLTPSPSPSPSPSASASVSATGSTQKRKRNEDLISSSGIPSYAHPFTKPYSSMVSLDNHEPADNLLHSQHDEHDPAVSKNGQGHPQFDSMNGVDDADREDFEDDDEEEQEGDAEEDGEDEEDEAGEDRTQTSASRSEHVSRPLLQAVQIVNVKAEPATEVSREGSSPAAVSTVTNPPSGLNVGEVKPSLLAGPIQTSGAYCAREENLKKEEDSGRLRFVCHSNDGVDRHMVWLIGLKSIFSRQLPNMPKDYIVRLVMDRSHKSMMIIKNNNVVGGITYRPYPSQKFGEIAFLAITADEQVKGYGTRLMNHLKQYARDEDGLSYFLTYADNNAVGYFTKQGFSKEIEMDKEVWHGYIKDYDGGTLMECKIDPKLPYTDLPTMIRRQREAIDQKIRELSNCHIVYPGLDIPKVGLISSVCPTRKMQEYREDRIELKIFQASPSGLLVYTHGRYAEEAGWVPDQWNNSRLRLLNSASDSPPTQKSLNAFMRSLLKVVTEHGDSWPFKEPVDAREVPDYYEVIKDPVDLRTLSKRLDSEQFFITLEMFEADMMRMFSNARTYNSSDTIYFKAANRLQTFFINKLNAGIQGGSRLQHP